MEKDVESLGVAVGNDSQYTEGMVYDNWLGKIFGNSWGEKET